MIWNCGDETEHTFACYSNIYKIIKETLLLMNRSCRRRCRRRPVDTTSLCRFNTNLSRSHYAEYVCMPYAVRVSTRRTAVWRDVDMIRSTNHRKWICKFGTQFPCRCAPTIESRFSHWVVVAYYLRLLSTWFTFSYQFKLYALVSRVSYVFHLFE